MSGAPRSLHDLPRVREDAGRLQSRGRQHLRRCQRGERLHRGYDGAWVRRESRARARRRSRRLRRLLVGGAPVRIPSPGAQRHHDRGGHCHQHQPLRGALPPPTTKAAIPMSMERWTDARPPLPATGKQLDVYDRQLDPRRFRYLATRVVGFLALIILSLIFIAAALLVGFTTVWLAAALVTTDVTVRPSFGFRPRACDPRRTRASHSCPPRPRRNTRARRSSGTAAAGRAWRRRSARRATASTRPACPSWYAAGDARRRCRGAESR